MILSAQAINGLNKISGIIIDFKSASKEVNGWTVKGRYGLLSVVIEKGIQSGKYGAQATYTIKINKKQIVSETSLDRMVQRFEDILSIFA